MIKKLKFNNSGEATTVFGKYWVYADHEAFGASLLIASTFPCYRNGNDTYVLADICTKETAREAAEEKCQQDFEERVKIVDSYHYYEKPSAIDAVSPLQLSGIGVGEVIRFVCPHHDWKIVYAEVCVVTEECGCDECAIRHTWCPIAKNSEVEEGFCSRKVRPDNTSVWYKEVKNEN